MDGSTKVAIGVETHEPDVHCIDHLQDLLHIVDDKGIGWDHGGINVAESGWAVLVIDDGLQPPMVWVSNSLLHHRHG